MEYVYAVNNAEELQIYQSFTAHIHPRLNEYIDYLRKNLAVHDLPRAIVWTSAHTATQLISNIPIPAYTNDFRVVITPDIAAWRTIYLKQLDGLTACESTAEIREYYQNRLNERHVLQILGHELAHHSDLFLEDFSSDLSDGIWFEEGMAEYISRRYFLTEEEFEAEIHINRLLVDLLEKRCGGHSLEEFGAATYDGDYAGIFFQYWSSFLAVNQIVNAHGGDIHAVFQAYHRWNATCSSQTLCQWFGFET